MKYLFVELLDASWTGADQIRRCRDTKWTAMEKGCRGRKGDDHKMGRLHLFGGSQDEAISLLRPKMNCGVGLVNCFL